MGGVKDIACNPVAPQHIFAAVSHFDLQIHEVWEFNPSGQRIRKLTGFGDPGQPISAEFDRAGNMYVASAGRIFKNRVEWITLPCEVTVHLKIDSQGNLFTNNICEETILRIDPAGNITTITSIDRVRYPGGMAVDGADSLFVADNDSPPSIKKIDPSGNITTFVSNFAFEPFIQGMAFDPDGNLYAVLMRERKILKFDPAGNATVIADATDNLKTPGPILFATCPVVNAFTCGGNRVTVLGTTAADTITGTTGRDVIYGSLGNDTITGLGGSDVLCGGRGHDSLNGGGGNDRLFGQIGDDILTGGAGNDQLAGSYGEDILLGGGGDDRLDGGHATDECDGGSHVTRDTALNCEVVRNVP